MPKIAAIFKQIKDAESFRSQLLCSPWSSKVSVTDIGGSDIFNIVNKSSSSIKLSSREDVVIEMRISQSDLEELRILINDSHGQYVPQDEFIKWGI